MLGKKGNADSFIGKIAGGLRGSRFRVVFNPKLLPKIQQQHVFIYYLSIYFMLDCQLQDTMLAAATIIPFTTKVVSRPSGYSVQFGKIGQLSKYDLS